MKRQHATPVLLSTDGPQYLNQISLRLTGNSVRESVIEEIVHSCPSSLPIREIDAAFANPVAVCRQLNTPAGAIDNFLITPSGMPILVECKLWRNPEARREVVGQILDYAKALSRWSSSDLQREVNRALKAQGNALLRLVRDVQPDVDETAFNDAVTSNLRRGRFLLLIVGDGIREGVEAIAEYLQTHAGLHFSLGLVEFPIFELPDGTRMVVPRVLARTTLITRTIVAVPPGHLVWEESEGGEQSGTDDQLWGEEYVPFWRTFLKVLRLDDPEQVIPAPARQGYLGFALPAAGGSCWLTVYRNMTKGEVGVILSSHRNTAGEYAVNAIVENWQEVKAELGPDADLTSFKGRPRILARRAFGPLTEEVVRERAFAWLAERVNTFVNVLRPRVRSAAADYAEVQR